MPVPATFPKSEDPLTSIMEGVAEEAKRLDKQLEDYFDFVPLGFKKPTDEEMFQFGEQIFMQYPPDQQWSTPSGMIITGSAWLLAANMPNVSNGKEWITKLQRAAKKVGGSDAS